MAAMHTPAQRTAWLGQFAASLRTLDQGMDYATAMRLAHTMWPGSYLVPASDAAQAYVTKRQDGKRAPRFAR